MIADASWTDLARDVLARQGGCAGPSSPGISVHMRSGADLGHRRLRHAGLDLSRMLHLSGHEPGDGSLVRRASGGRSSPSSAPRSSRTRAFSARCSSTTTCTSPITCAAGCRGTSFPTFYRLNRAALIDRNGGLVYRSYVDVARRYLLTPHHGPVHPDWDQPGPHDGRRADRGAADVRPARNRIGERRALGGNRGLFAPARKGFEAPEQACPRRRGTPGSVAEPEPPVRPDLRLPLCEGSARFRRLDRDAGICLRRLRGRATSQLCRPPGGKQRRSLETFRGAVAAVNGWDSNTGMNLFRATIAPVAVRAPFFASVVVTGSHLASLEVVADGRADLAAIDCVTYGLVKRLRSGLIDRTAIIAGSPLSPGLPFIASALLPLSTIAAVREALFARSGGPWPRRPSPRPRPDGRKFLTTSRRLQADLEIERDAPSRRLSASGVMPTLSQPSRPPASAGSSPAPSRSAELRRGPRRPCRAAARPGG